MDHVIVKCKACSKPLKIPKAVAAGKQLKCPCGHVFRVGKPKPNREAERQRPANQPAPPATKSCPYCGESIKKSAVKCRHCGEFLQKKKKKKKKAAQGSEEMTPAEYIVATLFCPVGLVIGMMWRTQKLEKAGQMTLVSGLSCVIAGALSFAYFYYQDNTFDVPTAVNDPGIEIDPSFSFPGVIIPDEMPSQPRRTSDELQGDIDLTGQPPEIQRAFKANVRIEVDGGVGSGVVVSLDSGSKAIVLTNRHVVDADFAASGGLMQTEISNLPQPTINFIEKEEHKGDVVWLASDGIDLALVRVACPDGIEPVPWQPIPQTIPGQEVFAIGNPAGLGWTFTKGVVSALRKRTVGEVELPIIQTDTSISPGSSGGGLYNSSGQLIGINTFIVDPRQAGGLGFAIRTSLLERLNPGILENLSESPAE